MGDAEVYHGFEDDEHTTNDWQFAAGASSQEAMDLLCNNKSDDASRNNCMNFCKRKGEKPAAGVACLKPDIPGGGDGREFLYCKCAK